MREQEGSVSEPEEPTEEELERAYSEGPKIKFALMMTLGSKFGYDFEITAQEEELRFEVVSKSGRKWRSQAWCHEEHNLIRCYHFFDEMYEAKWSRWVQEAVSRMNEVTVLGCYEFQWSSGAVVYRNSMYLGDVWNLSPAMIHLLNSASFGLDLCERVFGKMGNKDISPRDAVALAQFDLEVLDGNPRLSPAALKSLLTVEKGTGRSSDDREPPRLELM